MTDSSTGFRRVRSQVPDLAQEVAGAAVSIAELAQLTPWTEQAIRTMISKGIFVEGKHYCHVGRRTAFKWKKVCQFIDEGRPASAETEAPVPHYRDRRKR